MRIFRKRAVTRVFCLCTGVIFLNMSFFLAEVCMLELKDKEMIENVCNLVINTGLEEERETHGGGSDIPVKEFSIANGQLLLHHSSLFLITEKMHQEDEDHYLPANHSEIFSPPPESIPSFR